MEYGILRQNKANLHHPLCGESHQKHNIRSSKFWGGGLDPLSLQLKKLTWMHQNTI